MPMQRPIFVVAPRGSGAALLFELLDRSPQTRRLDGQRLEKVRKCATSGALDPEAKRSLRKLHRDCIRGTRFVVVGCLERHGLSVQDAVEVWPHARFVYVFRNPADGAAQEANNAGWEAATRGMMHALSALPSAQWCAVNYTNLLADPDGEAGWLGKFLGLTFAPRLTGGAAMERHLQAAALRPDDRELRGALLHLSQQAEALVARHHAAWAAVDLAKTWRQSGPARSVERFQRAVVSGRVAAGVCLATALPQMALAATYTVTSLNDSGTGSLRDAISQANSSAGPDVIQFQNGLTGTITLSTGVMKITDSVTIQGPGAASLAVDGNHASTVFYPYSKTNLIDVIISGLTVQNGNTTTIGGGVAATGTNLTVENCVVQNSNAVSQGGGIGISTSNPNDANIIITNTAVLGNKSYNGGGVAMPGTSNLVVQNSNVSGNSSSYRGGGIYAHGNGNVTVQQSTISANAAGQYGGGITIWQDNLTVSGSTIVNNTAQGGAGLVAWGAGAGTFRFANSTIAGNTATGQGGGMALYYSGSTSTVTNCTISDNTANGGNGGGGLWLYGQKGEFVIRNTIVANNVSIGGRTANSNQIGGNPTNGIAVEFSLISDANDVLLNPNVVVNANNILGQDPNLSPLANNGGNTTTMMPAPDSPVVNAGDPNHSDLATTDQRGRTRVVGSGVDLGAVELQACGSLLEGQVGCAVGSVETTGGTAGTTTGSTTAGATTAGSTTGSNKGGGGCATAPGVDAAWCAPGLLAAAAALLRRRRRTKPQA